MTSTETAEVNPTQHFLDPEIIGPLSVDINLAEADLDNLAINAVILSMGVIRQLRYSRDVFGLIMSGYYGFRFMDNGETIGLVASRKDLNTSGIQRVGCEVEAVINQNIDAYEVTETRIISPEEARRSFLHEVTELLDTTEY